MLIGVAILIALALFTAVFTFLMLRRGNTRVSKRLENIRKDKSANTVPEPVAYDELVFGLAAATLAAPMTIDGRTVRLDLLRA